MLYNNCKCENLSLSVCMSYILHHAVLTKTFVYAIRNLHSYSFLVLILVGNYIDFIELKQ
jgi:hypothetical protein